MRKLYAVYLMCAGWVAAADAPTAAETENTGGAAVAPTAYVEREEKVVNFVTGRTETERVIEFRELEILPDISRPVTIIIPRHKPNFDEITFTIFNNEPSLLLPDVYRLDYYRRLTLPKEVADDEPGGENFAPQAEEQEGADAGKPPENK